MKNLSPGRRGGRDAPRRALHSARLRRAREDSAARSVTPAAAGLPVLPGRIGS